MLIVLFHHHGNKCLFLPSQLVSFGLSNQMVVTFKEENLMTFKHLFLKDYVDGGMDTYAVYRQAEVYDHIDYIIRQVTESFSFISSFLQGTPGRREFYLL